jgi:hypothetical protein
MRKPAPLYLRKPGRDDALEGSFRIWPLGVSQMSKREPLKAHGAIFPVTTHFMKRPNQCRYDQVQIPVSVSSEALGESFAAFHMEGAIELRKLLSTFIRKTRIRRQAHESRVAARRKSKK